MGSASLYVQMAVSNGSIRARSSSMPARPYMARFNVLRIDLPLGLAAAPMFYDGVPDGVYISAQRSRNLLHQAHPGMLRVMKPVI